MVRQLQIEFTPLALLGGEQRCKISTVRSIPLQFCLPIWISLARAMANSGSNDLNFAKKIYDLKRENAANQDDEVKKAQKLLSDSGASSTNDSISIYIERRWLGWKRR